MSRLNLSTIDPNELVLSREIKIEDLMDVLMDDSTSHKRMINEMTITANYPVNYMNEKLVDSSFRCAICDKQFSRKYNLLTHLHTHERRRHRPFLCTLCPSAFFRNADLQRHQQSVHERERSTLVDSAKSLLLDWMLYKDT